MENKIVGAEKDKMSPKISQIILTIAVVFLIIGGIMFFARNGSGGPATGAPTSGIIAGDGADESQSVKTINISSKPFEFSVEEIRVKKGDRVRINLNNTEGFHDWVVDEFNARTKRINAGQSDSIEFTADKTGTFEYYCSVGNHRQMGMVGQLIVE